MLSQTPEQIEFSRRARAWLEEHAPDLGCLSNDLGERFEQLREWQRTLYQGGWLGLTWPTEFGGQGLSPMEQVLFNQELARAQAPAPVGVIGLEVVGPTIIEFGSDNQRKRFVPPMLRGEEIWCQGFSEPEAGSDLASLRTRAIDDGDAFVVSGQKVWTSWASFADWCALLVRTDPDAPKHLGISYLMVDMHSPGVTVRPLTQMTGEEEFGEVFFDEVRVPKENLIGELNQGWRLALHTLEFERGPFALKRTAELKVALQLLVEQSKLALAKTTEPDEGARALAAQRIGRTVALVDALEARGYDTLSRLRRDAVGPASSLDKLFLAHVEQALHSTALDMLAPFQTVLEGPDPFDRWRWIHDYFYSRAQSIYGGSAEIQRNILADRFLRLPST